MLNIATSCSFPAVSDCKSDSFIRKAQLTRSLTLLPQGWAGRSTDRKLSLHVRCQTLQSPSSSKNISDRTLDHNNDNDAKQYKRRLSFQYRTILNSTIPIRVSDVSIYLVKPTCRVNVPNFTRHLWQVSPSAQSGAWGTKKEITHQKYETEITKYLGYYI
jgi:hypothetical protein